MLGVKKRAMITGIRGQDGSYLAEFLLRKDYEVHGVTRSSNSDLGCSQHLANRLVVHRLDMSESDWHEIMCDVLPDELYHFAADSFVPRSWEHPLDNLQANTGLPIRILEAIRQSSPRTRLLNACSREIYGGSGVPFADENTPMSPVTPYGINKDASRWTVHAFRDRYGVFGASAILFNHESPRRGAQFVTRKITRRVAEICLGKADTLQLGNLQTQRDWGFAGDYVDAMWRMLQISEAQDFVIGTGKTHSIEEFASRAFAHVGLDWRDYVTSVPHLARLNDTAGIAANPSKAQRLLDWSPQTQFEQLVAMMVQADLADQDTHASKAA